MGFTAIRSLMPAMAGAAIAVLLSACSGNGAAGNAAPATNAAVRAPQAQPGAAAGSDVDCSTTGGQVGAAGGPKVDLIAKASDAGTPGCTEAFTVIKEYYAKAPHGEGPGRRVSGIQGHWDCAKAADPDGGRGVVVCGKDGHTDFRIETAPGQGAGGASPDPRPRRFPNTTQTVQFTGYDAAAGMARFQLVAWQAGGPDDGRYLPVPGDTKTYRLPLSEHDEVYSAITLCSGNSVTVDSKGRGTKQCAPQQLKQALAGTDPLLAEIQVDGSDQITVVKEIYHP